MPAFSVVIPCYNRAYCIRKTIDSVLSQTFVNFELIIVDDCSDDNLIEALSGYDDGRLIYARNSNNLGASASRNVGVSLARGRFIAFLDSDDRFLPEKLEKCYQIINAEPDAFLFSQVAMLQEHGARRIKPKCEPHPDEPIPDYLFVRGGFTPTPSIVVSRDIALKCLWNENLGYADDSDYAIQMWKQGVRFYMINECLVECDDSTQRARLSQEKNYEPLSTWIEALRGDISESAYFAFRATHLLSHGCFVHPLKSLYDMLFAVRHGYVAPRVALKFLAKGVAPRGIYGSMKRFIGSEA